MDCTKSDSNNDVKPQDVFSTIVLTCSYETEISNTRIEFANPMEMFSSETENEGIDAADIHPDGVGEDGNLDKKLFVEGDDAEQILSTETLGSTSVLGPLPRIN